MDYTQKTVSLKITKQIDTAVISKPVSVQRTHNLPTSTSEAHQRKRYVSSYNLHRKLRIKTTCWALQQVICRIFSWPGAALRFRRSVNYIMQSEVVHFTALFKEVLVVV